MAAKTSDNNKTILAFIAIAIVVLVVILWNVLSGSSRNANNETNQNPAQTTDASSARASIVKNLPVSYYADSNARQEITTSIPPVSAATSLERRQAIINELNNK